MPSRRTRRQFLAGAAAAASAGTAGCTGSELTETAPIDRTVAVDGVAELAVSATVGDVEVRGADREDVRVTGRKRAASERDLEELTLAERREGDRLTLHRDGEDQWLPFRGTTGKLELQVEVPRDLRVAEVLTSTGVVDVRDVTGPVELSATTGEVRAEAVDGAVSAAATTGDVAVDGTLAAAEVTTGRVDATVRGLADPAEVEATTGEVELALAPDLDVAAALETDTGSVTVGDAFDYERDGDGGVATLGDGTRSLSVSATTGQVTLSTL